MRLMSLDRADTSRSRDTRKGQESRSVEREKAAASGKNAAANRVLYATLRWAPHRPYSTGGLDRDEAIQDPGWATCPKS
jgi:hypothetical protein